MRYCYARLCVSNFGLCLSRSKNYFLWFSPAEGYHTLPVLGVFFQKNGLLFWLKFMVCEKFYCWNYANKGYGYWIHRSMLNGVVVLLKETFMLQGVPKLSLFIIASTARRARNLYINIMAHFKDKSLRFMNSNTYQNLFRKCA